MGDGLTKLAMYYYCPLEHDETPSCWDNKGYTDESHMEGSPVSTLPSDTVIIFDWDDTLLCSTAINRQEWSPSQLQQLERNVETILRSAMRLGEVHIITNGNETWVLDSAAHFFPRLLPTLSKIQVMSARATFEPLFPGDPFQWKRQAFREVLARRCSSTFESEGVNLIALGDSLAEIEAAGTATKVLSGRSLVKTVKFKELPSANELLGQLRKVKQELRKIVQLDSHTSRGLSPRPLPAHLDHLAAWASGWRVDEREDLPTTTRSWAALFGA